MRFVHKTTLCYNNVLVFVHEACTVVSFLKVQVQILSYLSILYDVPVALANKLSAEVYLYL